MVSLACGNCVAPGGNEDPSESLQPPKHTGSPRSWHETQPCPHERTSAQESQLTAEHREISPTLPLPFLAATDSVLEMLFLCPCTVSPIELSSEMSPFPPDADRLGDPGR